MKIEENKEKKPKYNPNWVDYTFGLTCKMTYKEFCEMKATHPNWRGKRD